ncbi:MAG: VOC family protein [Pseudomonadota bacterium]
MISYVCIGVDDMAAAERFYTAFLPELGYQLSYYHGDLSFDPPERDHPGPSFYVKRPFDGAPARSGNGNMVAFEAPNQAEVRRLHARALEAGGTDEGAPGFRADYDADFFVSYLRDPQGNKIALYSVNPADPTRDS